MKLSILQNATPHTTTYYVGNNLEDVKHLKGCTLICRKDFNPELEEVNLIQVDDPQLYFYKLSHKVKNVFLFNDECEPIVGHGVSIGPGCVLGDGVQIGDNVEIGANTVIYANTKIGPDTIIGSNVTIGTAGMMWVWDGDNKVILRQLGGVDIGKGCTIGSGCVIVRGSANEITKIGDNTILAPATAIGHGAKIGNSVHFANNVTVGGSVTVQDYNFFGCAAVINPRVRIMANDVLVGAGAVITREIVESGVYVGAPAKKIKEVGTFHRGIPKWTR